MTEYEVQRDICRWLDAHLPPSAWYCHVPNGGSRKVREMAKFKAMGLKPGTPDLLLLYRPPGALAPWVIWMEVKRDHLTEPDIKQMEVMATLKSLGCHATVVCNVEQVQWLLEALDIPLKGDYDDGYQAKA